MISFFQNLIDQGFALVYIDDILLLGHTKTSLLDWFEQLHQIYGSNNPKMAPDTHFIFFSLSKILDTKLAI